MITNKMKKQPDHNRFKDSALQDGVFRYPPYQGTSGVYPVSVDKESRGWIAVCLLLCLAIVTAGVCGGLVLRYTQQRNPLGSEKNPAGIGQAFFIESQEQVGSSDQMAECKSRITLMQVVRGDAAANLIAGLPGNSKPRLEKNQEYYIAKFKIELLESTASHGIRYSSIFFDAMNQHDEKYMEWMDDIEGNFPVADMGEASEGMIVFVVEKDDDPVILYKASEDHYYYFHPGV